MLFSNTVNDVNYSNLNLVQTGTRPDGRPVYGRVNSTFSDVILLRNTDQGDNWMVTGQLERRFRAGGFARGAYSYGRSNSISDTTNSTARSTCLNVYTPGNVNDAPLAVSNFDLRHRLVLSGSYNFGVKAANVLLSMFYSGQTGRPYSYNFGLDANSDGSTTNDLLFYPTQDQVNIVTSGFTYQDLVSFIEGGDCDGLAPGSIVERNSCRMPFTHSLDFRAAVNVEIGRFRPEFTVDVINLLNLFDSELGQVQYTPFSDILVTTTNPTGVAVETAGKYNYNLSNITRGAQTRFSRDDLRSRWQAQIRMRVRF